MVDERGLSSYLIFDIHGSDLPEPVGARGLQSALASVTGSMLSFAETDPQVDDMVLEPSVNLIQDRSLTGKAHQYNNARRDLVLYPRNPRNRLRTGSAHGGYCESGLVMSINILLNRTG